MLRSMSNHSCVRTLSNAAAGALNVPSPNFLLCHRVFLYCAILSGRLSSVLPKEQLCTEHFVFLVAVAVTFSSHKMCCLLC